MKKLIMVLVLMPLMVLADSEKIGDVTWTFRISSDNKVSIKGAEPSSGDIEIPKALGGMPVVGIGADAFFECFELTSVTIPKGVEAIGEESFCGCSGLISVAIPSSVTSIGRYAFEGCTGLTTVYVSKGDVEGVLGMLADSDSGLDVDGLIFVETVENGGPYTETTPDGLTWHFMVRDGNAEVGIGGLYGTRAISTSTQGAVNIPTKLGGRPVTSVAQYAFRDCNELTAMTIPEGVTVIGKCAFELCCAMKSVSISSSVTNIEEYAFAGCGGLMSFNVDARNLVYCAQNGLLCSKDGKTLIVGVNGEVVIPSGVTNIGHCAFEGCDGLTSVTIPECVTHVDYGAFEGCSSLLRVNYLGNAPSCGGMIYYLTPEALVSYIRHGTTGWLAEGAMNIPLDWNDRKIEYSDAPVLIDGVEWICHVINGKAVVTHEDVLALGGVASGEVNIPDRIYGYEVTKVGANAFAGLEGITSVVIPASVRTIESKAFAGCTGLTFVTIPSGVTSIGDSAFDGCSGLTSMTIPASVTSFGYGAFYGCSGVTSITLPAKVSSISSLFGPANGIKSVIWTDDGAKTSVTANSCYGCENLEQVVIPANVMNVGDQAFYNCHKLKSVVFEGNAPDVGTEVFNGTPKDMVISVPVDSIGWDGGFTSTALPSTWGGRAIAHVGESYDWSKGTTAPVAVAGSSVTVSNVVVHYILNSVQPEFAIQPADDMNFVNIITEVKGSAAVAIPETWAASYPTFAEKFGTDFTQALMKPTGKIGTGGTPMLVWQDYVAGTDPTDEKDVFTASITIVDGKVTISYTPELDDERKAMRKYTTWGKTSLMEADWTEVQDGREAEYNFFKVSVEMR